MTLKQETADIIAKFADKDENTMTKTDWRSEFRDKMNSMITTIQQRKMTAMSMQNETEDFIEQTRLDAQIEVLEKVLIREFYKDGSGFEEVNEDRVENEIIRLKTLKQK